MVLKKNGDQLDLSRKNEEVLHSAQEDRSMLHRIKRRKGNWIGHILHRNCLLKHVIEGKVDGRVGLTERRERRYKQLLDELKENDRILEIEIRSRRSHSLENSLRKML
jgi:hypothetical protein